MLLSELYAIYLCVHKRPKSRVVISGFLLSYPLQVRFVQAYFRPCTRLLCVFRVAVDHIMVLYNVDCACVQLAPASVSTQSLSEGLERNVHYQARQDVV